jgi:hypothetical protein
MATKKSSAGPTPNGGVRSEIHYLDDDFKPADESVATRTEIIEFDASGEQIHRTHGVIDRSRPEAAS